MLAIHNSRVGFHPYWVEYCERKGIPFRLVDCRSSDIIEQIRGCRGLMWHHSQSDPKDILIARQILSACEHAGLRVFPNFRTAWHFDDKVAQKYLFEALNIPAVPAHVFVDRDLALEWSETAEFPKVFKLRRGAGSAGVRLVQSRKEAKKLIKRAFGRGFSLYDPWGNLKERAYKVGIGKMPPFEIVKALMRFVYPPRFSQILGRERGYVYFQDYLPENSCDIRVIVIGDRAFGICRLVRPGDFRASGSGLIDYQRENIDERCVKLAFEVADRLGGDCVALDFVFDEAGKSRILEVSYGFSPDGYHACAGHWDRGMRWHPGAFDPQGWIVDLVLEKAGERAATLASV